MVQKKRQELTEHAFLASGYMLSRCTSRGFFLCCKNFLKYLSNHTNVLKLLGKFKDPNDNIYLPFANIFMFKLDLCTMWSVSSLCMFWANDPSSYPRDADRRWGIITPRKINEDFHNAASSFRSVCQGSGHGTQKDALRNLCNKSEK